MIDFVLKDKALRKEKLPLMCNILISHWSQLDSWWRESSKSLDNKLAAVTLLQKLFNAQPKVCILCTIYDGFQLSRQNCGQIVISSAHMAHYWPRELLS